MLSVSKLKTLVFFMSIFIASSVFAGREDDDNSDDETENVAPAPAPAQAIASVETTVMVPDALKTTCETLEQPIQYLVAPLFEGPQDLATIKSLRESLAMLGASKTHRPIFVGKTAELLSGHVTPSEIIKALRISALITKYQAHLFREDRDEFSIHMIVESFLNLAPDFVEIENYMKLLSRHKLVVFGPEGTNYYMYQVSTLNRRDDNNPKFRKNIKFKIPNAHFEIVLTTLVPAIEAITGKSIASAHDINALVGNSYNMDGLLSFPFDCSAEVFQQIADVIVASSSLVFTPGMDPYKAGNLIAPIVSCVNKQGNVSWNTQFLISCAMPLAKALPENYSSCFVFSLMTPILANYNGSNAAAFCSEFDKFKGKLKIEYGSLPNLLRRMAQEKKKTEIVFRDSELLSSEFQCEGGAEEWSSLVIRTIACANKDIGFLRLLAKIMFQNAQHLFVEGGYVDVEDLSRIVDSLAALDSEIKMQTYIDDVVQQSARLIDPDFSANDKNMMIASLFEKRKMGEDLENYVDEILANMAKFKNDESVTWSRSRLVFSLLESEQPPENLSGFIDAVLPHVHKVLNLKLSFPNLDDNSKNNLDKAGPGFTHDKQYFILNGLVRSNKTAAEAIRFIDAFVANVDKYCAAIQWGPAFEGEMVLCGALVYQCKTADELVEFLNNPK